MHRAATTRDTRVASRGLRSRAGTALPTNSIVSGAVAIARPSYGRSSVGDRGPRREGEVGHAHVVHDAALGSQLGNAAAGVVGAHHHRVLGDAHEEGTGVEVTGLGAGVDLE